MPEDKQNIIDAKFLGDVYAVPLKPENYDELIEGWDQLLSAVVASAAQSPTPELSPDLSPLETHFKRSYEAVLKIGRQPTPIDLIHLDPKPCIGISADGTVSEVNFYAHKLYGFKPGDDLKNSIGADQRTGLLAVLAGQSDNDATTQAPGSHPTLSIKSQTIESSGSFSYVPLQPHKDNQETVAKLVSIDLTWNKAIGEWMKSSFHLTHAESEVLRFLVSGKSLQDLAAENDRSIETVRSQLKNLLRKTGMSSQVELVRLFSGFGLVPPELRARTADKPTYRSYSYPVEMPDGRLIQVDEYGPASGRPVIFLHGMMDGTEPTKAALTMLEEQDIRLICPWRPGFAGSTGHACETALMPLEFADDIERVMQHLRVPPCPLVGHMAGALYAFAAATHLPDTFTAIINISGTIPITSDEQISMMSTRQRVIAFTAKYTPKLVEFILRAAVAQVDAGGADKLVRAMYQGSPNDKLLTENSEEIRKLLFEGYRASMAQGQTGFLADGFQVLQDWSQFISSINVPVHLIHGVGDPTIKVSTVRALIEQYPRIKLTELPNTGQLVLYSNPELVIDVISQTDRLA